MNYKVMLAKVLSEKELADMDIKKITEDDALLEKLIRKEYALGLYHVFYIHAGSDHRRSFSG